MIYLAKYNRGRKSKALQATDLTQGGAFADIVAPQEKKATQQDKQQC